MSQQKKPPERHDTSETSFVAPGERTRTTGPFPAPARTTGSHPQPGERERVTQKMFPSQRNTGPQPIGGTTAPKQMTGHQKDQLASAFQDQARLKAAALVLGKAPGAKRDDDDDEATALGKVFDGVTPAPELTSRDLFKAVQAPVQSREGRRSKKIFHQVLAQFAIGKNPRFDPDGPGKPRGHIFVWDVSRAMNCEVPHFFGVKELTLAQTVDWLRAEGPSRGWLRADPKAVVELAGKGQLVIALPKEMRLKQMGIVTPEPADKDGRPRLAGAGVKLGPNLSVHELLGVYAAEFFTHA
ncbi:MAG: hypothetical protein JNK82_32625 [Myxococcaceae bacterium]|nr:hypothetical protein [Myxococcaceae bacterium]